MFALGVTAYRLVTDSYPPSTHPYEEESRCWLPGGGGARPPRQLNPRVDAQLNALILRMLSPDPEERGTAGELAEALERGVAHGGPAADAPLFEWETQPPSEWTPEERAEAELWGHRPRHRDRQSAQESEARAHTAAPVQQHSPRRWLPWLAAVLALGLWPEATDSERTGQQPTAKGSELRRRPAGVRVMREWCMLPAYEASLRAVASGSRAVSRSSKRVCHFSVRTHRDRSVGESGAAAWRTLAAVVRAGSDPYRPRGDGA